MQSSHYIYWNTNVLYTRTYTFQPHNDKIGSSMFLHSTNAKEHKVRYLSVQLREKISS